MAGVSLAVVREQGKRYGETLAEVRDDVTTAIENERLTRARVANLEAWAAVFSHGGFWRRLRWLLVGR